MHGKIFLNRGCLQFLVIFSFLISPSFGQNAPTTPRTQQATTTSPATPTIATTTSTLSRTSPTASTTVRSGVTITTSTSTEGRTSSAASTAPSTIRSTSTNATTSPSSNRTTAASLTTVSLSTTRPPATNATTSSVTSGTSVTSSMSVSLSTTPSTTNATTPSSANRTASTAFTTSIATSTARSTGSNSTTLSPQNGTSTVSANSTLPSTVTTIATAATGPSSTTLPSVSVTASNQANFSTTTTARNTSSPTSNSTTTTSSSFTTFSPENFSSSSASLTTLETIESTNTGLASTVPPLATASITESDASASDSETTEESDETSEFTDVTDSSKFETDSSKFETDSTVEGDPGMEGMSSDDQLEEFETDLVQAIIPVTKDVTDALEVFNGIFVGEIIPLDGVVSNITGKKLEETIRKWRLFRSFLDTLDKDATSSGETDLTRGINFTPEDGKLYELSNFVTQTSHDPGTLKSAWAVIDGFLVSWKHLHHLTLAANGIIEQKVTEMKKAIIKATENLDAMNGTLQDIYKYKERLAETARDMSVKSSLRFIKLKEVHREIQQMKSYDKEVESIYNTILALQTRGDNQEKKQEDNENYDEKQQQLHSILESKQHAFFAQRTSSCSQRDTVSNYEINNLNQGGAFNKTSGIFTVPVNGIYYFYFSALKTKQGGCGTSRLSIQIVQTSPTFRVLAGIQMDSGDWFGWFPLQLQAPANLVVNDQIGVKLSEGCIYGNGSVDHLTTNFGGFVIAIL